MTDISFVQNPSTKYWEAEVKVDQDSALHIERLKQGTISIGVKSVDAPDVRYAPVRNEFALESVIDCDLVASVYPKYIKIVSQSEVKKAFIA